MGATKARRGLFGLGMLLLGSLVVVDAVWAQGEVSFIARTRFWGGRGSSVSRRGRLQWRWALGSGHRQSRCQHRVDPAQQHPWCGSERPRDLRPDRSTFTSRPIPRVSRRLCGHLSLRGAADQHQRALPIRPRGGGHHLNQWQPPAKCRWRPRRHRRPLDRAPRGGLYRWRAEPEEAVDVPFRICLTQRRPFRLEVAVVGVADASADAHAKAPLVK